MPRKRLTEEGVKKLRPLPGKQLLIFDTVMPGLLLNVSYGGAKTWRALHYINGKPVTFKLGRYPILNLKEARDRARDFIADPDGMRRRANSDTFDGVADDFLQRYVQKKGLRTAPDIERKLRVYVRPHWGNRRFTDIGRNDVTKLLDGIEDDNGPSQADAILALLSKMFNWYQTRNEHFSTPIVKGMRRTNPVDRRRKRKLSDNEIRVVWTATKELGKYGALVRFLLLTCQRKEKVATLKHTDIQHDLWVIASEKREKSNAGTLRLPRMALDLVESQPRLNTNPHVFPAALGRGPFNSFSQRKEELDALVKEYIPNIERWTLHDLRRTGRSLMSRAKVSSEIAERVLGHALPGIEDTYNRHDFLDEKSEALEKLANLITEIVSTRPRVERARPTERTSQPPAPVKLALRSRLT